jgi:ribosomal protein S14
MISKLQTSIIQRKYRVKFVEEEANRTVYKYKKIYSKRVGVFPIQKMSRIYFKNYCLVTGKARSVYAGKFRLSRHQIKNYFIYLTGLRISSW